MKVKMKNIIIWFSMGIEHSNPYVHSTTVLCDYSMAIVQMHSYIGFVTLQWPPSTPTGFLVLRKCGGNVKYVENQQSELLVQISI